MILNMLEAHYRQPYRHRYMCTDRGGDRTLPNKYTLEFVICLINGGKDLC